MPPESSKFGKRPFQGFMENGPQRPPKMKKINSDGFPGGFGPQWFTTKNFVHFQDRVL